MHKRKSKNYVIFLLILRINFLSVTFQLPAVEKYIPVVLFVSCFQFSVWMKF